MGNLAPMYLVPLHWHRLMSVTESTEVKPNLEEKSISTLSALIIFRDS